MQKSEFEPGLLQVFRFYAWLRAGLIILSVGVGLAHVDQDFPREDLVIPGIFMVAHTLALVGFLYWHGLERKLGRFYFPTLMLLATAGLIIEQYLFTSRRAFWQVYLFLAILVILVAWQYSFRLVLFYILGMAAFELFIGAFFFVLTPFPMNLPVDERLFNYILLGSRSITFVIIGYIVNRLVKAQRQQRQALAEANQKLVSHAATLEQLATSRERLRLSRELHDTLAHTLSAQAVQMDAILTVWQDAPPKAKDMLEDMLSATRTGLDETRRAMQALRSSALEEMGLSDALRSMAEDFAARHSLALEINLPEKIEDLPPEVEQCFYRVAQEALENSSRHAHARKLALSLNHHNGYLELAIQDDGKGFNPQNGSKEEGLGLRGMYERAELIGAKLSIDSQERQGTTVRLRLEINS